MKINIGKSLVVTVKFTKLDRKLKNARYSKYKPSGFSKRFQIHSRKSLTTNFAPKENPLKTRGKNESQIALQSLKDFQRKGCNKKSKKSFKVGKSSYKNCGRNGGKIGGKKWRENTKVAEKENRRKNGSAENVIADP